MKRQFLTLFLTLLILISVGGVISIVGAASHVTPVQVTKPVVKEQSCPYVGNSHTGIFYCPECFNPWRDVINIKPEHKVCFNSASEAMALGYRPAHCCCSPYSD